jgi:hypothetical protein
LVRDKGLGRVLGRDQAIRLPAGDEVAVDAAYYSSDPLATTLPFRMLGALAQVPELVIERGWDPERRAIFERAGVREYWVVEEAVMVGFALGDSGTYGAPTVLESDAAFASALLPDVSFPVAEILP